MCPIYIVILGMICDCVTNIRWFPSQPRPGCGSMRDDSHSAAAAAAPAPGVGLSRLPWPHLGEKGLNQAKPWQTMMLIVVYSGL